MKKNKEDGATLRREARSTATGAICRGAGE